LSVGEEDGTTVFHIPTRGVNGVISIRLWRADTKELLWHVNLNSYQGSRLMYGEVPRYFTTFNGGRISAQQIYPAKDGKPKRFPGESRIFVMIEIQYDTFIAASAGALNFVLTPDTRGEVTAVSPIGSIDPDDFPDTEKEPNSESSASRSP
jgi:hypothetical protein